ncbi:hypothetical protein [Streptomyces sp. NBC_01500]|uniref:hypothetical protein n=1 Tax=unclassified Streptomyces TaxID=2593676 RepID=UPI002B1CDEEA|nr:hypothetical protein [Streptomyces sp. NBC_01500]
MAGLAYGLAPSPTALIAARVVQGLGAALLTPQTMTLIVAVFPAEGRGAAARRRPLSRRPRGGSAGR